MLSKYALAAVLSFLIVHTAAAQTVRFDTNVGNFDLELNPTGNANLQPHVNNILGYVQNGLYDSSVINRADEGFVMQMGGFRAPSLFLPPSFDAFTSIPTFAPVIVDADGDGAVDFDVDDLTNTRRTVSLALSTDANTGTSSFFVNLGTNSSLDDPSMRFVPFAVVPDMTTIDLIMSLDQMNYTGGSLAGDDVPVVGTDRLVVVERAFVVTTPPAPPATASLEAGSTLPLAASAGLQSLTVPETSTLILAVGSLMLTIATSRRRIV